MQVKHTDELTFSSVVLFLMQNRAQIDIFNELQLNKNNWMKEFCKTTRNFLKLLNKKKICRNTLLFLPSYSIRTKGPEIIKK